jgi:RND family efflux transporter MFP subunit
MSDEHHPEAGGQLPLARTSNGSRVVKGIILIGACVGAAVSVIAARAYKRPDPQPEPEPPGMKTGSDSVTLAEGAPQWSIVHTAAASPAAARWSDLIPARVVFDETRTSRLGAPVAGHVTAVYAERGQAVKAGQPLYAVSSSSLADLRSDLEKAKVERETARKNLERTQSGVDAGVLADKLLVAAKQQLAESEVALQDAQQRLTSINASTGGGASLTVSAPRQGVVVEKTIAVGQTVSPDNGSLMAIADVSSVWIVADLYPADLGGITEGARAMIVVGNSDSDREGVVDQVSAVVDPDRHTVPIRIKLENADGVLRPNAHVQVRLFDPNVNKVMLPASAVMSDGEHSFVYIENPKGVLKRRNIVVGSVSGGNVPVKSGLEPDERVVTEGVILVDNQIDLEN